MHRVRMLIHFGVRPYIVFDGDYLPSKKETERERSTRRREAKAAGLRLLQTGKSAQAYQELQKAIDVTPEMAKQFMNELEKASVDFIVAPYEADAQLVYMEKKDIIQGIISEDSDMLVFGAKSLLTKLDQFGECVVIDRLDFTACREISLVGWSDAEFRWMAILSGCDYLAPITNVGLKTAYRLLRKHKTVERVVKALQFDGKSKVPAGYLDAFRAAELTFLHQWVYCPVLNQVVNITVPGPGVDVASMDFIGVKGDDRIAQQVATGKLHPHTKQQLQAPLPPAARSSHRAEYPIQHRTPSLKKHHSIESFFKPKRIPLAELDPNCFTPSPSQQRLLEQQQQEHSASDVQPRPATLFRAVTDVHHTQSTRRMGPRSEVTPGHVSPKRQRLCSDSAIGLAMTKSVKSTSSQSRFFSKPSLSSSPSVLKANRRDRGKTSEVGIWSDDFENAMAQPPEILEPCKKTTKKIDVFRDTPQLEQPTSPVTTEDKASEQSETQTSIASLESATWPQSQDDVAVNTPLTSMQNNFPTFENATTYSRIDADQGEDPERVPCSSPAPPSNDGQSETTHEEWTSTGTPMLKPLPVAKEFGVLQGKSGDGGSEHVLLVPDSDCEEDEQPLESDIPRPRSKFALDLGRFAFAG